MTKRRALLSVTDKTGLVEFARGLSDLGFELLSTGGTASALRSAGLDVVLVSDVTGFPEILGGRVKTLHPLIHGGLLGDRRDAEHVAAMAKAGIEAIEVVAVNLYAFEKTVTGEHELEEAVESIDIGGPAMVRASAKNFANVTVVVDPDDYGRVLADLSKGGLSEKGRLELSAKAFRHTAFYDSMVSRYLTRRAGPVGLVEELTAGYRLRQGMRYGENPHQGAALYVDPLERGGVAQGEVLWGKEMSYNNFLDADAAWELVGDLPEGSCAIIKHGNPCGAALGGDMGESYRLAKASDPVSAFGGIAAFHGRVDLSAAGAMTEKGNFLEVVIGSGFDEDALAVFRERSGWGQDVRLVRASLPAAESYRTFRTLRGGVLVQDSDEDPGFEWEVVTQRGPSAEEWAALRMAWRVVPHVKSNAIVVASGRQLLGVGAGQMNRVQSVRLALEQARGLVGEDFSGLGLASDAFFPFPDSMEVLAGAGIRAVVQPGGSKKDGEVVAKADELGVAMVFTRARRFRH